MREYQYRTEANSTQDFRSKDGLYNLIPDQVLPPTPASSTPSTPSKKRKAAYSDDEDDLPSSQQSSSSRRSSTPTGRLRGQDLFDARVFQNAASTTMFNRFIASLRQKIHDGVKDTSTTHKFIRTLRDGGRLMRCYTQNIDSLEAREGLCTDLKSGKGNKRRFMKKHYEVPRPTVTRGTDFDAGCEVVQLHGDLESLRCTVCATQFTWTDNETEIFDDGFAPKCQKCSKKSDARQATGKRGLSIGSLRPNIVLYGEDHPSNSLLAPFVPFDAASQPEVLLIMGTSLKVFGLQKVVREFAKAIHEQKKGKVIFVNRTRPAESVWDGILDYFVPMDCDDWVEDLKQRRSDLFLHQGHIDLKVAKPAAAKRKRPSGKAEDKQPTRPKKKVKISVEIPAKEQTVKSRPKPISTTPSTPSHQRFGKQQKLPDDYPGRKILSPLAWKSRPKPSPLGNHFHTVETGGLQVPGSPRTPTRSPMTPRMRPRSMLGSEIFVDDEHEVEIAASDHGYIVEKVSGVQTMEDSSRAEPASTLSTSGETRFSNPEPKSKYPPLLQRFIASLLQ